VSQCPELRESGGVENNQEGGISMSAKVKLGNRGKILSMNSTNANSGSENGGGYQNEN